MAKIAIGSKDDMEKRVFLGGKSSRSYPKERSRSSIHPGSYFEDINTTNFATHFTKNFGYPDEWHTGKLPHRNKIGLIQFITFRLADSLPHEVLRQIEMEIKHLGTDRRDVAKRKKYQYWLDKSLGCCALSNKEMAQKVMDALIYHDGNKYDLLAWSIMPNHVHVLIKCNGDLIRIIQSWKSYTGKWGLANNNSLNLGIDADASAFWMLVHQELNS